MTADVQLPGRMSLTISGRTEHLRFVLAGGEAYINANRSYWSHDSSSAVLIGRLSGHWVRAPASTPSFTSLTAIADPARVGLCVVWSATGRCAEPSSRARDSRMSRPALSWRACG
jgi:hypothetical protein